MMGWPARVWRALFPGPVMAVEYRDAPGRPIRGSYDAARDGTDNANHWANADAYSADAANSLAVRQKITRRSRYETENNGHGKGIVLTHTAYVVGRGPMLRMQTKSPGYNSMVEAKWIAWCKAVKFGRKVRTAHKAKTRDGEGILIARQNPRVKDPVKLDLVGIECEQMQSPGLAGWTAGRVDGVWFDEYGNPEYYDVLKFHPGGSTWQPTRDVEKVPAKYVFHMFREDRPGQHRAVPELSATLNLFAGARRFRDATVAAAETCANTSMAIQTNAPADTNPMPIAPFSTVPMEKNSIMALPLQWQASQIRAEHPAATHSEFVDVTISEEARPLGMSRNIAACDSSGYSFSGGKLDHLTYFVGVDVDQADIEDTLCDPLFALWYEHASDIFGWVRILDPYTRELQIPSHRWAWPPRPKIDDGKTANARQTDLSTGVASPSEIANEDGYDWEDRLQQMATDYGVTVEEIQAALFAKHLLASTAGSTSGAPPPNSQRPRNQGPPDNQSGDDPNDMPMPRSNGRMANASANGNGRFIHG